MLSYADALRVINLETEVLNPLTESANYYYIPKCVGYEWEIIRMRLAS